MDATLCALVMGPSGHGKSWACSTTPPPRLIIDLEGRAKYTPAGRTAVEWDGLSDPMQLPKHETAIVVVTDVDLLRTIYQWLASGKHPWTSVTVDSLMEAQMRTKSDIAGVNALRTQDWGVLLSRMENFVRLMRDLPLKPYTGVKVLIFITGVGQGKTGYLEPMMQGQIGGKIPYWMDTVCYLERVVNEDGEEVGQMWIGQRPQNDLVVMDGTDVLRSAHGPCIVNPNFTELYAELQASLVPVAEEVSPGA